MILDSTYFKVLLLEPKVMIDQKGKIPTTTPFFLLLGKQNDKDGLYSKIWVDISLPDTGFFSCINYFPSGYKEAFRKKLEFTANQVLDAEGIGWRGYQIAELAVMDTLEAFFTNLKSCCIPTQKGQVCGECPFSSQEFENVLSNALEEFYGESTFNTFSGAFIESFDTIVSHDVKGRSYKRIVGSNINDEDPVIDASSLSKDVLAWINLRKEGPLINPFPIHAPSFGFEENSPKSQ
jgi:hypothetical protein